MTKFPSKNQIADFWMRDYSSTDHCVLCGNRGVIDTRGKVFTAAGFECGDMVFCICPNGQTIRQQLNGNISVYKSQERRTP